MGIFDDLQKTVSQSISDFKNVGLPALEAQAEQGAINSLSQMQQNATQTAQAGVADILNRPSDPNSFISQTFKNIATAPVIQMYGPYLLAGVVLTGVVAVFIFGGKHNG